ncbi:hypothetical protein Tco_0880177, partial [Tanacetum coccineum]
VSKSNPFDVLTLVENDVELGTNGGTSNLASQATNSSGSSFWNVDASSPCTTPVTEKIDKIEKLIIEGKVTLMDDDGKPLKKVDSSCDNDSEDEVASVDNDMAKFLAKKGWLWFESLRGGCPSRWESVRFCPIDASIRGWQGLSSGHEAKFIKKVVQEISLELSSINFGFDEKLVSMETRVKDVVSSLEIGVDEDRMIGIKGMGGAGKTTTHYNIRCFPQQHSNLFASDISLGICFPSDMSLAKRLECCWGKHQML